MPISAAVGVIESIFAHFGTHVRILQSWAYVTWPRNAHSFPLAVPFSQRTRGQHPAPATDLASPNFMERRLPGSAAGPFGKHIVARCVIATKSTSQGDRKITRLNSS